MKHTQKARLVIKALMEGYTITTNGSTYGMSEDFDILMKMESYTWDENGSKIDTGERWLPTFMTVSSFIQICNNMTEPELIGVTAQLVLNSIE